MGGGRASVGNVSSSVWPEGKVVGSTSSWWEVGLRKMPAVAALMRGSGRRWGWEKIGEAGAGRCAQALRWGYQNRYWLLVGYVVCVEAPGEGA